MDFIKLNETCYYFSGPSNIGYVQHGKQGLLIDAGLDETASKKVLKMLDQENLPLTHLFITHAHADHYGGAAFLQKKKNVFTIVPKLEDAILANPILEPMYLFYGNIVDELRSKFLEGQPIQCDLICNEGNYELDSFHFTCYSFPGHSVNQLGILIDGILYAGDAYFSNDTLTKHKIPFIINACDTLRSLDKLLTIKHDGAVPGHGEFEKDIHETVEKNITFHKKLIKDAKEIIEEANEIKQEDFIKEMCIRNDVTMRNLTSYTLFRTAIMAYAIYLINDGMLQFTIKNFHIIIQKNEG